MLSGIGPADHLQEFGIPVVHDLPGVGQNLRDHMTDLELTLTMLGETAAVELHRDHNAQGFEQLQADVKSAGEVARLARVEIERRAGRSIAA